MSRRGRMARLLTVLSACALLSLTLPVSSVLAKSGGAPARSEHAVCDAVPLGFARCLAHVRTGGATPAGVLGPVGYNPADLQSAYNLPSSTAGAGQTVAIVDAYNDPYAVSDVSLYRDHFNPGYGCIAATLAVSGCTFGNGSWIRKVDQNGGTSYPKDNGHWAEEISLDLDMVSAICPRCNILLVEANNDSLFNLGTAVNQAALLGANAISNSYGAADSVAYQRYDANYYHPGVAITASTGDNGDVIEFPASSRHVTAVGGTTLARAGVPSALTRGWAETAWRSGGSGCSSWERQPKWQQVAEAAGCRYRATADVSAIADPITGVSVYDSYPQPAPGIPGPVPLPPSKGGWLVVGGTSASSPIIASVYALAGNEAEVKAGSYPYLHGQYGTLATPGNLNDVVLGANDTCGTILCTATIGWDGPTGLGTPNGIGAF